MSDQMTGATALWCVHRVGRDDLYAAPSKETAQHYADLLNTVMAATADEGAVVCPWPWSPAEHAMALRAGFVDRKELPADLAVVEPSDPAPVSVPTLLPVDQLSKSAMAQWGQCGRVKISVGKNDPRLPALRALQSAGLVRFKPVGDFFSIVLTDKGRAELPASLT